MRLDSAWCRDSAWRFLPQRAALREQGGDRAAARGPPPDTEVVLSRLAMRPSSFARGNAPTWNRESRWSPPDRHRARLVRRSQCAGPYAAAACREAPRSCFIQPLVAAAFGPGGYSRLTPWNRLQSGSARRARQGLAQKICMPSLSVQSASALGTPLDTRADVDGMESHCRKRSAGSMYLCWSGWTHRVGGTEDARQLVRLHRPPGPAQASSRNRDSTRTMANESRSQ